MAERHKNSTSIRDPGLSSLRSTEDGHSISRALEDPTTCRCGTLIPAGSNSSIIDTISSPMFITRRFLKFKVAMMEKEEMLELPIETTEPTRNGLFVTAIPYPENPSRD